MKEELRKEIVLELANGSKISAATLRRWMRKHSMSREGLWKCVREVEGATVTEHSKEEVIGSLTLDDFKQVVDVMQNSKGPKPKAYKIDENVGEMVEVSDDELHRILRPSVVHTRYINPFLLLKVKRAWKQEYGYIPSEAELMEAQKKLIKGEMTTIIPGLSEKILSL